MNIIDRIISVFSPEMRSTLELEKINKIMEAFNNGDRTEYVKLLPLSQWRYQKQRASNVYELLNMIAINELL